MTTPEASPRKNALKVLLPVFIILAIVVGGLYGIKAALVKQGAATAADPAAIKIAVGETLPDIKLQTFHGPEVALSQLPGKVTLINFWATWCEACMVEMPSIIQLRSALKNKGFDVAAISLDDNPDQVLPASLPKMKIDFPVFQDPDSRVAGMFDVRAIPLTLIIDHNRRILHIEDGERDWNAQDIRGKIEKWLNPSS